QGERRDCVAADGDRQGDRPAVRERRAGVAEAEGGNRELAGQGRDRRLHGEAFALTEGQQRERGRGGERETDKAAADQRRPTALEEGRGDDQGGRQQEFQQVVAHDLDPVSYPAAF